MVLRRSDARRRRLVIDPAAQTGDADAGGTVTAARNSKCVPSSPPQRSKRSKRSKSKFNDARAYSFGAERRNQLKTTDLIPKRVVSYLMVVLVLVASLAAISFLSIQSTGWQTQIGNAGLTAFSISGQGSIANWFVSFLLILTGLFCLQIYAIRQHRCDDYRGTYRLWVWMAALFVAASVNCVVDLGTVVLNLVQAITGQSFADRVWLLLTLKLTFLTALVARIGYEVRQSRGTLALAVFIWSAYTLALVVRLPIAQPDWMVLNPGVVAGNCVLFGTAALLLAHLTYGRFIFMQANGLIQPKLRARKAAAKKKTTAAKKRKTSAVKTSQKRTPTKQKKARGKTTAADKDVQPQEAQPQDAPPKTAAKNSSRAKSKPPANSTKSKDSDAGNQAKPAQPAKQEKQSPSEVLKELAAASRAKQKAKSQSVAADEKEDSQPVIKMSKSQRRKQRKLEKQRRRAA